MDNLLLPGEFDDEVWAAIMAENAVRAAREASKPLSIQQIQQLVARIKIRVAEPTSDNVGRTLHDDTAAEGSPAGIRHTSASVEILDIIFTQLDDEKARIIFNSHDISDVWLPLSRQTLRRLFTNSEGEKRFMEVQDSIFESDQTSLGAILSKERNIGNHLVIYDDENHITEHRVLGEGACGIVEEVSFKADSAIMRCVRKRIGRPKLLNAHKKIIAAFAREICVMRQVNHQHCVRFLGSYTDFDHVNILSTPVADMDLATFLDKPINRPEREVLYRGFGCLCNAINYLHQHNIRHEDLKPQNVLISGENILLTDFGFSLDFSDDSISTTTGRPSAWTIRYSAPEVLDFEPRNRATDIWSLGCILLEMISGFQGVRLGDLKDRWKRTGNGQSSFARNEIAVTAWFDDIDRYYAQHKNTPTIMHLCILVRMILNQDRLCRPSAQQIVDRIADISLIVFDHPEPYTARCPGPKPCIGLSRPTHAIEQVELNLARLKDSRNPAMYLYPWSYDDWTFGLWDLEWNELYNPGKNAHWNLPIRDNHDIIRTICQEMYDSANRTGATESFWRAHQKASRTITSDEGKAQALLSAKMLSLKNVVCRRLALTSPRWRSVEPRTAERHTVQITLLPVCLQRSPVYGCFLWMISWEELPLSDEQ